MFKTLQNGFKLELSIVPDGPILVRAQTAGIDPAPADMEFQRTHRNGRSTVFLAGSGLKGVLRSHSERLLRSAGRYACDPTRTKEEPKPCGNRRSNPNDPMERVKYPHAGQCSACFTFGSLRLAGRFRVSDAYPVTELWDETNRTEVRTGVGIERVSQAAKGGVLYDAEVVVRGGFRATISGENFSLWQIGLVLAALRDLDSGFVQIGGAKARGMGSVKLQDWNVDFRFLGTAKGTLAGARPEDGAGNKYGLPARDAIDLPAGGVEGSSGLFRTVRYAGASLADLEPLLTALDARLAAALPPAQEG